MTQWSDIIPWGKPEKPDLTGDTMVQLLFLDGKDGIVNDIGSRTFTVGGLLWSGESRILAYRYEIKLEVLETGCYWGEGGNMFIGWRGMAYGDIPLKAVWDKSKEPGDPEEFTLRRAE